ncbi:MAG: hypothetical protein PF489_00520, partial [Salinivirgaceae bacterium]|nr:hypothetical protein [Salinivirgaceae bacterium]
MKTKENIVYLDNEPENLIGFKSIFKRFFNVFVATSAEEVLRFFDDQFISVAIFDFNRSHAYFIGLINLCRKQYAHTTF